MHDRISTGWCLNLVVAGAVMAVIAASWAELSIMYEAEHEVFFGARDKCKSEEDYGFVRCIHREVELSGLERMLIRARWATTGLAVAAFGAACAFAAVRRTENATERMRLQAILRRRLRTAAVIVGAGALFVGAVYLSVAHESLLP